MQSTKQELSPYNQIYFSKQVFVYTTKYSNIFIFTIVKKQILLEIVTEFFPEFIVLTPPCSSVFDCQKFAEYKYTRLYYLACQIIVFLYVSKTRYEFVYTSHTLEASRMTSVDEKGST